MSRLLSLNNDIDTLVLDADNIKQEAFEELSKFPPNIIKTIEAIVDFLETLQTGTPPADDSEFDTDKMIDTIKQQFDNVFK